jgi:F0F1-type ATP synthase assembly protein I
VAKKPGSSRFLAISGAILGLGFSLVGSAFLGMYLGSLMDRGAPTKIYTPIGLIFGLLVGFHRAWTIIQGIMKKKK